MAGSTSGWYEVVPRRWDLLNKNTIPCTGSEAGAVSDRTDETTMCDILSACVGAILVFLA
jgi:hypothetical protein